jgi:hypothetical protein
LKNLLIYLIRYLIIYGAHNWNRTSDLFLTKEVLYRLSYVGLNAPRGSLLLERVMGIEPTPSAWKAGVLPLNYTRNHLFFKITGGGRRIRTSEG